MRLFNPQLPRFIRESQTKTSLPALFSLFVTLPVFKSRFRGLRHLQVSRDLDDLKTVWSWGVMGDLPPKELLLDLVKRAEDPCRLHRITPSQRGYPLLVKDRRLGMLLLERRRIPALLAGEEAILPFLAVLKNEIHIHNLMRLVIRDELTGMLNKRAFLTDIRRLHASGGCYSLAALDIDRFKHYNDTYGHPAGDHLLRSLGRLIRSGEREGGYQAYRYGGEEITLVFPGLPAAEAAERMETVRRRVQAEDFSTDEWFFKLTISAGVADNQGCRQAEEVLGRADEALYRSKRAGRNRVTLWSPA